MGGESLAHPRGRLWSGRIRRIARSQAVPPDVCKKSTNGDNSMVGPQRFAALGGCRRHCRRAAMQREPADQTQSKASPGPGTQVVSVSLTLCQHHLFREPGGTVGEKRGLVSDGLSHTELSGLCTVASLT